MKIFGSILSQKIWQSGGQPGLNSWLSSLILLLRGRLNFATLQYNLLFLADEMLCVDERTFLRYQKLQEQLKALQDSYGPLTADPNVSNSHDKQSHYRGPTETGKPGK